MELNQITEVIKGTIDAAYKEGFEDGSVKQAIMELRARDRFLEKLRVSKQADENNAGE